MTSDEKYLNLNILKSQKGFTLIEIVISLIIVGIMGAMLVTMGQTALTKSAALVGLTQNSYNLETVMENINSDYISMINPANTGQSILDDLYTTLSTSPGSYAPSGYTYSISSFRFNAFVAGTGNTLVSGSADADGNIMRVTIGDASGMSLTALFFDNSN